MSTHGHPPGSTAALRSLAEIQLQVQASRAATLEARAIGVMGVDAAVATIILSTGLSEAVRTATLAMLVISASMAARSLLLEGAKWFGPSVARLLASREIYGVDVEESILYRLAADVKANEHALARKMPRLVGAILFLALAAMLALAGVLY